MDNQGINIIKKSDVNITYKIPPPIHGTFDHDNIWRIPVSRGNNNTDFEETKKYAFSAYSQKTKKDLVHFLHGCAGFPKHTTWIEAVRTPNQFATWPGLTVNLISKYLDKQIPTVMGHMTNTRMGIRSTKTVPNKRTPTKLSAIEREQDLEPPRPHLQLREGHQVTYHIVPAEEIKGLICTDLPGRFPIQSFNGNNYIFVLYDYDSNAILAKPIKSRKTNELIRGYEACYTQLVNAGIKPIYQRLDNEKSDEFIKAITAKGMKYQLITAHDHRTNLAERAIRTLKEHFTAILNGTD